jgi:arylsulfatase
MMPHAVRNGALLGLISLAILLAAWLWRRNEIPQFNLLLITVDTLRADHLGFHGYQRNTSPAFDRFAERSVTFMDASVQVPKTLPSLVSMMTATYPGRNGVLSNAIKLTSATTLARVLERQGFHTEAFVANPAAGHGTGMEDGFVEFEVPLSAGRADRLTNLVLERMKKGFDGRFFLWVHYIDPHGPYNPPAPYNRMFYDDEHYVPGRKVDLEYTPLKGFNTNYVLGAAPRYQTTGLQESDRAAELDSYIARYDGEIRFWDDQLGRLLDWVAGSNLAESTIIAITADHGEALGEHEYFFEHGWFVYQDQVHVPLAIHHPRMKPRQVSVPVELVELAPALLQLLWVDRPPAFQGKNLLRTLTGEAGDESRIYSQNAREYPDRYRMLRSGSWKYVVDQDGAEELYDLSRDEDEVNNLALTNQAMVAEFRQRLRRGAWNDTRNMPVTVPTPEPDDKVREALRTLGYVN